MVYNFWVLELKQSYISHLKVLVCVINAFSLQLCGCIFMSCYIHVKLAFLVHKKVLVSHLDQHCLCINYRFIRSLWIHSVKKSVRAKIFYLLLRHNKLFLLMVHHTFLNLWPVVLFFCHPHQCWIQEIFSGVWWMDNFQ